jgi:uridylate kinase
VILAAGTGRPFVTTDSGASMRAVQLQVDCLLKASTVDGVYDSDPRQNAAAQFYPHLSYDEVIAQKLGVMDLLAFEECKAHRIAIRIFNGFKAGALTRALLGEAEGSLIDDKGEGL